MNFHRKNSKKNNKIPPDKNDTPPTPPATMTKPAYHLCEGRVNSGKTALTQALAQALAQKQIQKAQISFIMAPKNTTNWHLRLTPPLLSPPLSLSL